MGRRTAIVTGYSSGLGEAIASELLKRDWLVVGVSRSTESKMLHQKFSDQLVEVHGSVEDQRTADLAFNAAGEIGRDLCLVVNCAGVGVFGQIGQYSADEIHSVIGSNLSGLILFSDHAAQALRVGGGHIVNIMSTAGKKLRPSESVYVAAKWGAKAYTRTLREALKIEKSPIKVIEVYPGGMQTPFWVNAVRSPSNGSSFPSPEPIAIQVVDEVEQNRAIYCQEFVFERS